MKNRIALSGILAATAVGVAIGLAYAPDKGSKTRKKVRRTLEDLSEEALEKASNVKATTVSKANELYTKGKEGISSVVNKVKGNATGLEVELN